MSHTNKHNNTPSRRGFGLAGPGRAARLKRRTCVVSAGFKWNNLGWSGQTEIVIQTNGTTMGGVGGEGTRRKDKVYSLLTNCEQMREHTRGAQERGRSRISEWVALPTCSFWFLQTRSNKKNIHTHTHTHSHTKPWHHFHPHDDWHTQHFPPHSEPFISYCSFCQSYASCRP